MHFLNQWVLTILLLVPLVGAVAVALLRGNAAVARRVALGTTVAACAVSVMVLVPFRWRQMLNYDDGPRGSVKLAQKAPLPLGAEYYVAADGLSIPFIFLTTLLFALLCTASWGDHSVGPAYFATLLLSEFATLGTYVCFDFLVLVALMAFTAVTIFILSRMTGTEACAGRRFLTYTAVGIVCLIPAMAVSKSHGGSFDLLHSANSSLANSLPAWALVLLAFGLLIRMAAVPVHTWLVTVIGQAKVPVGILMTCVLPITGAYGLMRVAVPLSLHGSGGIWAGFAVLGVVGFLCGALCAMASTDLRTFIAYSAVSTAGCVLFAIGLHIPTGFDGAVMVLLGHGLVTSMLLFLNGAVDHQSTGEHPPLWTAFFSVTWIAWLVVPLFGGQAVVMLGGFEAARTTAALRVGTVAVPGAGYGLAVVALFGVLANGVAAARMARHLFRASNPPAEPQRQDLGAIEVAILSILGGVSILLGVFPWFLCYTFTHPAARAILHSN
jgi:NADH-quinone oxidoreductase subunit M